MIRSPLDHEDADYKNVLIVGTVIDNNDPLKKWRVKVTVPGLWEAEDGGSPWIFPERAVKVGTGPGFGEFGAPAVNSDITIILQNGDVHYPLYRGTILRGTNGPSEGLVNYPNRRGWKDEVGNIFIVDTTTGGVVIQVVHKSGTTMTINNDGSVSVTSQTVTWNVTGTLGITASTAIDLTAPTVTLDASTEVVMTTPKAAVSGDILDQSGTNTETVGAMRTTYDSHDHNDPQGGVTGTPNQLM